MPEKMILWLSRRLPASSVPLIGPKAAGLCTLRELGMRVPPCFFVTTPAFREHLDTGGLRSRIASLMDTLDARPDGTQPILDQIRRLVVDSPPVDRVREQIAAAYGRLGADAVAVRSSATAEDLPGHSFAGQYETILGVTSPDDCLEAIKKCWASLWTERAYEYRRRNGIEHRQVEMAVIVQQQIEPDAAGVAFSLDPVTGSHSRIVIEACRGLGEALVSGKLQPDRILLRKKNFKLIRQNLVSDEPLLGPKTTRRLARSVRRVERRLGYPQDIEWAVRGGTLWFLQTRPVTAIPEPKRWEDRQVWTNLNLGEVMPDVMTPMTLSIIDPMFMPLFGSLLRLLGADPDRSQVAGLVAGRLYFNANTGLAALKPFGIGPDQIAGCATTMGGDQRALYDAERADVCDEDLPDLGFRWWRYVLSWPAVLRTLFAHRPSRSDELTAEMRARATPILQADAETMDTGELARVISRSVAECLGVCDLLYLIPGFLAIGLLQRACRAWLGDENLTLTYRLFAAQGGIADVQAGLDMWGLAQLTHEDAATQAVMLSGRDWRDVRQELGKTKHGRTVLAAWDRFMTEHGHHCRGEMELFNPRSSERPDYILGLVRGYLGSVGRANPLENQQRLAEARQSLAEQCRRRLRNPMKRWIFNWSLRHGQKVAVDRENWKNLAVRVLAAVRYMLLVLGTRLKDLGILNDRDDVFFLELPEIEPVVAGTADFDVRQRIAERRAEYERNCSLTPPPVVVGRFDPSKHAGLQIDATVRELKGIAVSPGVATGKARVILRTDDHEHVEAGEILVAPFTDPAWTPYFLPAAAVVMDMGGVLSHGAIIARELGIPAVVNVGSATTIIRTGQLLRVDADRGTVTILHS